MRESDKLKTFKSMIINQEKVISDSSLNPIEKLNKIYSLIQNARNQI